MSACVRGKTLCACTTCVQQAGGCPSLALYFPGGAFDGEINPLCKACYDAARDHAQAHPERRHGWGHPRFEAAR